MKMQRWNDVQVELVFLFFSKFYQFYQFRGSDHLHNTDAEGIFLQY